MIREMAVALFDSHGGIEEGDVIVCREPMGHIGLKESAMWLWGLADISEALADVIASPWRDASGVKVKKRRYKIPLDKIHEQFPDFDRGRARNLLDEYQPLLSFDVNYIIIDPNPQSYALESMQIVWDKSLGEYI